MENKKQSIKITSRPTVSGMAFDKARHFISKSTDSREFILDIVKQEGYSLQFASDRLKADKEVVMEAVKQDGRALQFASKELQADKDVVLEAVMQRETVIVFASDEIQELCKDKNPVMAIKTEIAKEYAGKLQSELSNKQNHTPTKKLKI